VDAHTDHRPQVWDQPSQIFRTSNGQLLVKQREGACSSLQRLVNGRLEP